MEKNKFEFQKLELPQQVLIKETVQETPGNPINNEHSTQQQAKKLNNIGYYALTAIIFTAAGYQLHQYFSSQENNKTVIPENYISNKVATQPKKDTIKAISKPVYINFYDSIVFLNKIKGKKKIVSKGFDDYLKRNKLIVKVDDNYYNLFCEDLISSYSVGDSIP